MFEEYQKKVLIAYQEKKNARILHANLMRPTAAKLKNECLRVFDGRFLEKDKEVFSSIFGEKENKLEYIKVIKKDGADKLKPLNNFFNNKTEEPAERTIEMLAWLIDFKERPCGKGDAYEVRGGSRISEPYENESPTNNLTGEKVIGGEKGEQVATVTTITQSLEGKQTNLNKKIITTCSAAIIIFIAACLIQFWKDKSKRVINVNPLISIQTCMYWTGDHYEQIKCDQKGIAASKIPFDKKVLENFEKIKISDTLTSNSLGKVWYSKQNNKVDFYTDSAAHPTDDNRRLLPLTQYMLDKYVSYKRYALNIVYWSIGITFFILLFGGGAIYLGIVIRKGKLNNAAN